MRIVLLGFGSRGDVQPLLALADGLKAAGYDVAIAAGSNFKSLVQTAEHNFLPFRTNIQDLMASDIGKDWIENSSNNSLREAKNMRQMLQMAASDVEEDMLQIADEGDVFVSGLPLFMTAQTLAEKYNKRHITLQLVPINPTRDANATIQPMLPQRSAYLNKVTGYIGQYFTHWIFKQAGNDFRQRQGLPPMRFGDYARAYNRDVPVIVALSPTVVPHPTDWCDNIAVTGFLFYDAMDDWQPSSDLTEFIANGETPVYIGFGSMSSKDPAATTQIMVDALKQAGQRGIISSGWAGLKADNLPDDIYLLDYAPHDWLFPQMAGVVHHGGAGTTAAAMRAGVPQTVVSHMADQPYWGRRVVELGVGPMLIRRHKLSVERLADAIQQMAATATMQQAAVELGQKVRAEDGVKEAVNVMTRLLD